VPGNGTARPAGEPLLVGALGLGLEVTQKVGKNARTGRLRGHSDPRAVRLDNDRWGNRRGCGVRASASHRPQYFYYL
jgi:hypothetical protein